MTASFASKRSGIPTELESELTSLAESDGCELVHAEFKGGRLLVILDHRDGITLDQCGQFSRGASAILDVHDFGHGNYVLEVSSPGLDRQFYRTEDFRRFLDHNVRVRFEEADTKRKRTVIGTLDQFDESADGAITVTDRDTGQALVIPLPHVETARLEMET